METGILSDRPDPRAEPNDSRDGIRVRRETGGEPNTPSHGPFAYDHPQRRCNEGLRTDQDQERRNRSLALRAALSAGRRGPVLRRPETDGVAGSCSSWESRATTAQTSASTVNNRRSQSSRLPHRTAVLSNAVCSSMGEASLAGTRGEYQKTWPRSITSRSKWRPGRSRSKMIPGASSRRRICSPGSCRWQS